MLGLDAMVWGLLGGAIAGTVLTGAFDWHCIPHWQLAAGDIFPFPWSDPTWPKLILAILAVYASWALYCRDDLWRKYARGAGKGRMLADVVSDWEALMWPPAGKDG